MNEFYTVGRVVILGLLWLTVICGFTIPVGIRIAKAFVTDSSFQPNRIYRKLDYTVFEKEDIIDVLLPFTAFSLIGMFGSLILAVIWPLVLVVLPIGGGLYFLRWFYRLSVERDKLEKHPEKDKK